MTVKEVIELKKETQEIEFIGIYPYKIQSLLDDYEIDIETNLQMNFFSKEEALKFFKTSGYLNKEVEKVEIFSHTIVFSLEDFITDYEIEEITNRIQVKQVHLRDRIEELDDLILDIERSV